MEEAVDVLFLVYSKPARDVIVAVGAIICSMPEFDALRLVKVNFSVTSSDCTEFAVVTAQVA